MARPNPAERAPFLCGYFPHLHIRRYPMARLLPTGLIGQKRPTGSSAFLRRSHWLRPDRHTSRHDRHCSAIYRLEGCWIRRHGSATPRRYDPTVGLGVPDAKSRGLFRSRSRIGCRHVFGRRFFAVYRSHVRPQRLQAAVEATGRLLV